MPALAAKFGWAPGSAEEKIARDWATERYHGPADDAGQPVNFEGAARFNAIMGAPAIRVADAPRRPEWTTESFFRRFTQFGQ